MTDRELDLAMAKVAGIEVHQVGDQLYRGRRRIHIEGLPLKLWQPTDPTAGWNDVMEALKNFLCSAPNRVQQQFLFEMQCRLSNTSLCDLTEILLRLPFDDIGPRVICEAIVAMEEKHDNQA